MVSTASPTPSHRCTSSQNLRSRAHGIGVMVPPTMRAQALMRMSCNASLCETPTSLVVFGLHPASRCARAIVDIGIDLQLPLERPSFVESPIMIRQQQEEGAER